MLEGHGERHPDSRPGESNVDALELCPYSEETVAGCRHYQPISAHGDFPEAGRCTDAFVISGTGHIRNTICSRRAVSIAGHRQAGEDVTGVDVHLQESNGPHGFRGRERSKT